MVLEKLALDKLFSFKLRLVFIVPNDGRRRASTTGSDEQDKNLTSYA